jgi:type I restriction enzyme M protein
MLSKETKKKIDAARDILVGQLPLPSDQVELITIALIYKFMDDQDEELRQLGFDEAFFSGDLKTYSWQRLMSNEIDAEERVNIFIKGIEEIQKAAHIPQLFREIFKNTFLKFRDGRTLHLFLGVINGFNYDHSEELGNAFEYLLMSMGAQGENGQFRTPRNIIDFIAEVVDPDKGDSILDPACGTGGFLLSAYKHILRKYTSGMEHYRITLNNEDIEGIPVNWGDKLTSQDLQQLGTSIEGYDITPLMTRLARVNLFLHQFKSPRIHEYDTLTSEGRWKDKYDCILANPPFMTPKGGVTLHSKFRIRASKAEVLFSDYILEHLTPDGMAGFIVPEGIIFQNSGDYVELRKWLVNGAGLWAVVSLPAHVFQPYSGVKTSILFIDRKVARGRDEIILVKVENDGYTLNTNRAATARNDLPEALNLLTIGKKSLDELRVYLEQNSGKQDLPQTLIKPRKEFERLDAYKAQSAAFSLIKKQYEKCRALEEEIKALTLLKDKKPAEVEKMRVRLQTALNKQAAEFFKIADVKYDKVTTSIQEFFDTRMKEAVIAYGADREQTGNLLPHLREYLDEQREYSLSFDKYTGGNGPAVNSLCEMLTLGDVCEINPRKSVLNGFSGDTDVSFVPMQDLKANNISFMPKEKRKLGDVLKGSYTFFQNNDVLLAKVTPCFENGKAGLATNLTQGIGFGSSEYYVLRASEKILPAMIYHFVTSPIFRDYATPKMTGTGGLQRVPKNAVSEFQIPLPPLEIQKQIIAEIEAYQKVVDGCNLIIQNYKPAFDINVDWPVVKLHTLCETITDGDHMPPPKSDKGIPFVTISNIKAGYGIDFSNTYFVSEEYYDGLKAHRKPKEGDILYTVTGSFGIPVLIDFDRPFCFQRHIGLIRPASSVNNSYLYFYLQTPDALAQAIKTATGVAQKTVALSSLRNFSIPLPPLETQQKIVAELEQDLAAVAGAKRLKAKMEAKIRATIGRVWGEVV